MASLRGRIINCRVNPRTGLVPESGDIVYGGELGYVDKNHTWCWTACPVCGRERWVRDIPRFLIANCKVCCGRAVGKLAKQKGDKNPAWRGGKSRSQCGYIRVYVSEDSPFYSMVSPARRGKDKKVLEHRLVVAQHLGRCLEPWEIVHHINGIRDDNRIENLMLLSIPHHAPTAQLMEQVKRLEEQVIKQSEQIHLLTWHINELEREKAYGYNK